MLPRINAPIDGRRNADDELITTSKEIEWVLRDPATGKETWTSTGVFGGGRP